MKKYCIFILIILINVQNLNAQNLDLHLTHASGPYRGMAGAGIGAVEGIAALDLNPGGLVLTSQRYFSFSQSLHYYSYSLYRKNHGVGAINFDWNRQKYHINNILVALPINKKMSLGLGVIQKTNIFLNNKRRAITWSSLFNQDTWGNVYAMTFAPGYKIHRNLSLGICLYRYFGNINSEITGENHGTDADKWVTLESRIKGIHYRAGLVYKTSTFRTGIVFEPSQKLDVTAKKEISAEQLYAFLLPSYDKTKWELPVNLGIGLAYTGFKNIMFTFDMERRAYNPSSVQLNLFEFGGQPNWKDINIVRIGAEFYPFKNKKMPVRLGYAHIPQLYASNESVGSGNTIVSYENTDQNEKHLFTTGTTLTFSKWALHMSFEYSRLTWHRDLSTRWFIQDDYIENNVVFILEMVYTL